MDRREIVKEIVFFPATEWERFQAKIGRLTLEEVSRIIDSHNLSRMFGEKDGSITLMIPSKHSCEIGES